MEVISNYIPDLVILGHADLIKIETLEYIKKIYPNIKFAQWFLDRMDTLWITNKKRFLDKIDLMDSSFCTTDPKSLKINNKYNVNYLPNPVDHSFETLENYNNNFFNNDVFFAMSHGVHRGKLKLGKNDGYCQIKLDEEIIIEKKNYDNDIHPNRPIVARFGIYRSEAEFIQKVHYDNIEIGYFE